MGIETAVLASAAKSAFTAVGGLKGIGTGLSIFSGLSSLVGGAQQYGAAGDQAELAYQQAESRAVEQERVTSREARLEQEKNEDIRRRQKVAFLASGVELSGSPLLVLEETRRTGAENVNEILKAGEAGASATRSQGGLTKTQIKGSGRQAFMTGVTRGVGQIATTLAR